MDTAREPRGSDGPLEDPRRRVGILTTDGALVVTSWDAALAAMTGIAAERAHGRPLVDLVPDLDERGILPLIKESLSAGASRVLAPALHRYLIPCPPAAPSADFDRMQQRVALGPLRDQERGAGLVFMIEDVTARLEQERQLARELRAADPAARIRAIEQLRAVEPVDGIGPLATAIADDNWQVRRAAVRSLEGRTDQPLVEALLTELRDNHWDFNILSSALELLSMTEVDVTTALVDLLRRPDADLRVQAALALGAQKNPEAAAALLSALDDGDPNVRFHAIESLGRLGSPAAVGPLAAIAESRDFFLAFPALDALALINDPAVVPRILPLLNDDTLGAPAAEALGQIGDEDAVAPLVAALDRQAAVVPSIVDALAAIHQKYAETLGAGALIEDLVRRSISSAGANRVIDAVPQASGRQLRNLVVVLGWLRGAAIERTLTRLLGKADVHRELIEAIVRFGPTVVDRLVEQLKQEDFETRNAAVVALGRIGDRGAVPALVSLLEEEPELLVPVAGALGRIGDPRGFEPLLSLLGHESVSVRHAAIGGLNSIGHPEMAARIRQLLEDPDSNVRASAIKIAGYFGYADCADGLLRCCNDENETVRAAALENVGCLDDIRVLSRLAEALQNDTPRGRAAAAQALGYVDAPVALQRLEAALADPDSWVRYFAACSLGRRADAAALPALGTLASHDTAQHVRIAAIEAIGAIGGDAAAEVLAPLVEAETIDVANAAARALGGVGTPSAGAPLRRALESGEPARRAVVIEAIVRRGGKDVISWLRETASSDADPVVARAAVNGLAGLIAREGDTASEAAAALVDLALDPQRGPVAAAALARIPPAAIPLLGEYLSARDARVRAVVVDAMARLSHVTASAYLRAALDDTDATVRQKAIMALSRLGARGLGRKLSVMARSDLAASVRDTASSALSRYGSQGGNGGSDA